MAKEINYEDAPLVKGCKWEARPYNNQYAVITQVVNADFAAQLERDLNQTRQALESLHKQWLEYLLSQNK